MASHAGLLQSIIESPDDDAPRLVYADWLDEQGDGDRAEFIRLQCRLASFEHAASAPFHSGLEAGRLLPRHRRAFLASISRAGLPAAACRDHDGAASGFGLVFRRGFVEDVEVYGGQAAERLVERAARLFALTPLRHLRFLPHRSKPATRGGGARAMRDPVRVSTLAALVRLPEVARLRAIDLSNNGLGEGIAWALLASPHLRPETVLSLEGNGLGADAQQVLRERFGKAVSMGAAYVEDDDIPF